MKIFKFKWPYKESVSDISEIKYNGQPVGKILEVEETDEGIIVTGQMFEEFIESPEYKKLFLDTDDMAAYSLGPFPTMEEYAKADIDLTMSLFPVWDKQYDDNHGWIKPGTRMGCATVILASLGLWIVVYFMLHWLITGQAFPIFDWS